MPRRLPSLAGLALAAPLLCLAGCDSVKDYFTDNVGDLGDVVTRSGHQVVERAKGRVEVAIDEPWDEAEEALSDQLDEAAHEAEDRASDLLDDATGSVLEDERPRRQAARASEGDDPFGF